MVGRVVTGLVGHGMAGFNNFNLFAWHAAAIAGGDEAAQLARPAVFDSFRHCGCGFSCTHDNCAAARRFGQIGGHSAPLKRQPPPCEKANAELRVDRRPKNQSTILIS
jgi:hypothetical protein